MMKTRLTMAVAEAKRFLDAANAAPSEAPHDSFPASKETAAVRRASMDLTRALAVLRRPDYR